MANLKDTIINGSARVVGTIYGKMGGKITFGSLSYDGSADVTIPTQAAKTVTPSTSAQTAVSAGTYCTGAITVAAMASGALSAGSGSASLSSSNVTLSDTNNGISVTATGSGTVSVGTAGYLASGTSKSSSSATSTKYISAVTLPTSQKLSVSTAAASARQDTYALTVTNGAYRLVNVTNASGAVVYVTSNSGTTQVVSGSATAGTIYVKAYTDTTLDSEYKTVVSSGKWATNTVTPSTSAQGPYYGKTTVNAMTSGALSAGAGSASMTGSNVSLSDTNNGISVTATGSGTVSVGTAGYLAKDTSKTSNNGTATKYISGIVVPASKTLTSVVLAAGTSSARTYLSQLTVNGYSTISNLSLAGTITEVNNNGGSITVKAGNTSSGTVSINAYDSDGSSLSGSQQIVYQNKWKTTTVTPSTSAQGPFYGKTIVNAQTSGYSKKTVTLTPLGTTSTFATFYQSDGTSLGNWRYALYDASNIGFTPSIITWYAVDQPLLQGVWIGDSNNLNYRYWSYFIQCGSSLTYHETWPLTSDHAYTFPCQNGSNIVVTFMQ